MSAEWIKVEKALPDKPEIWQMADALDMDADMVVGKLIRVFSWFDDHTENGNAPSVTEKLLDRLVGVSGFTNALKSCGWLVSENGQIGLRNFERHNGTTAKSRALAQKRQERFRNAGVTPQALPEKKRKEYKRDNRKFAPPTVEDVSEYLSEKGISDISPQRFIDYYTANGWRVGKTPMKDWRAAVRTWIARREEHGNVERSSRPVQDSRRLTPGERTQLARERQRQLEGSK